MGLLNDITLRQKIRAAELIRGLNASRIDEYVHGCAVELHIGDIYAPGSKPGELGSASRPRGDLPHYLKEGETAVITTLEAFSLDDAHTAVVFPVSSVSFKGLLMTNPGHVDPGFKGHLHVTVINMGRKPYGLEKGARFLRALIFKLDDNVANSGGSAKSVSDELLDTLSSDFLSVRERGIDAAKSEVEKSVRTNTVVTYLLAPVLAALIAGATAWLSGKVAEAKYADRLDKIEKGLDELQVSDRLIRLETELPLERRLSDLEQKLEVIEKKKSGS